MKTKRQKFEDGAFVEIYIKNNQKVYGRLLPGFQICVYDYIVKSDVVFDLEKVISKSIIFYVGIYKSVITSGVFKVVGKIALTPIELSKIPPSFMQSEPKIDECYLVYFDGREEKVKPSACVGLERSSAYNDLNVVERIEDFYDGKKNFSVELNKVILNKDDPRYMNPKVKWSFKDEKFYRE